MLQLAVVLVLVLACASYAAWTLMPAVLRRPLALALSRLPLPRAWSMAMKKRSEVSDGCACDGCDKGKGMSQATADGTPSMRPSISGGVAPLVFHPRSRK